MPSAPGRRTFFDRPSPDDEDDFPPLSDEQERAAADRKANTIGTPEWKARVDANNAADKAAYKSESEDGDATSSPARRGTSTRSAGATATTAGGGALALISGKRPASVSAALLGMVTYAVAINFIHGGWPQVKGWLGAKFLNKPYKPAPAATSSTGATSTPAPAPAKATVYRFPTGSVIAPGTATGQPA